MDVIISYLNITTTRRTSQIRLESLAHQWCWAHFTHKWSSQPPGGKTGAVSRVLWQRETQLGACKQCQTQGRCLSDKSSVSQLSAGQRNMSLASAGTKGKRSTSCKFSLISLVFCLWNDYIDVSKIKQKPLAKQFKSDLQQYNIYPLPFRFFVFGWGLPLPIRFLCSLQLTCNFVKTTVWHNLENNFTIFFF